MRVYVCMYVLLLLLRLLLFLLSLFCCCLMCVWRAYVYICNNVHRCNGAFNIFKSEAPSIGTHSLNMDFQGSHIGLVKDANDAVLRVTMQPILEAHASVTPTYIHTYIHAYIHTYILYILPSIVMEMVYGRIRVCVAFTARPIYACS